MWKSIYQRKWLMGLLCAVICFAIGVIWFLLRDRTTHIYPAPYLDELLGVSPDKHISYIVKSPMFHTPKCAELETWAQQNLPNKTNGLIYSFSKYDKAITPDNAFLKHDYVAIGGDFEICRMNADDKLCFFCADNE